MSLMTPEEKAQIEARLKELRSNRPILSQRIKEAKELGDLKENGEYHAAREQQGYEEAEIRRLEDRLATAHVVNTDAAAEAGIVFLGSMVRLKDLATNRVETFKLVGEFSENPPDDYDEVTPDSPMGEALMKARVGDVVRFNAPRGEKAFEVLELL